MDASTDDENKEQGMWVVEGFKPSPANETDGSDGHDDKRQPSGDADLDPPVAVCGGQLAGPDVEGSV